LLLPSMVLLHDIISGIFLCNMQLQCYCLFGSTS
jgi:hypothetical protein